MYYSLASNLYIYNFSAIILDDENIGGNNITLHQSAVKIEENSTGVVVGVIVAVLFFLCCVFGIYCVWKRKIATKHSSFNKLPNINGVKVSFNYTGSHPLRRFCKGVPS